MKTPDWLPDWRDEGAYPNPSETTMKQWAWEFLRRNPNYQQDYFRFSSIPNDEINLPEYDHTLMDNFWCEPPALKGETHLQYVRRVLERKENCAIKSLQHAIGEQYDIRRVIDPASEYNPKSFNWIMMFKSAGIPTQQKLFQEHRLTGVTSDSTNEVIIKFDLSLPLESQLSKAKQILNGKKSYLDAKNIGDIFKKRFHVGKFALYLRVLDADQHGAELRDMAPVLLPDQPNGYPDWSAEKRLKNSLDTALQIRDLDYIYLPCLSTPKK